MAPETIIHLFLECSNAIQLWTILKVSSPIPNPSTSQNDNIYWLHQLIHTPLLSNPHKIPYTTLIPSALWQLWIIRNKNSLDHQRITLNIPFLLKMAAENYFLTNPRLKHHSLTPLYIKWHPQTIILIN